MALIEDVLLLVDATVTGIAADTYDDGADAVRPVIAVSSVLLMALVGINIMTQTVPLTYGTMLGLGLRIVLVNIFLIYGNIQVPYEALTNAPAQFGAGILNSVSGGSVTNLYEGLDELYVRTLDVGQAISQNGGWLAGALTSVLMFLVAALMATITIIVLCSAKIMLALLIAIAPLAIACTLFKQSAPLFEAWVKLAIGFSFVPLFVAAMAGFTIATGNEVAPENLDSVETIGDAISFVVVMMLGAGLMILVPVFAQSIAATNLGIGAVGSDAARYPGNALRSAWSAGRGGVEGARGRTYSDRSSMPAQVGNIAGLGARTLSRGTHNVAVKMASKMKKG